MHACLWSLSRHRLALAHRAVARTRSRANVAATVNGRAITYAELDKQFQSNFATPTEHASDDQVEIQKLEVLRTLVDDEIMLQRAEKQGLMAADADVEAKFNELKAPYTQEEFQKQLNARKMTVEDLKAQAAARFERAKLFNKEITSQISITDKDITRFLHVQQGQFQSGRAADSHGADSGDADARPERAQSEERQGAGRGSGRKEDRESVRAAAAGRGFCDAGAELFRGSEWSAQNGGDLGFIPESALERANAELRKTMMALRPGETTGVMHTAEGYRILKVVIAGAGGAARADRSEGAADDSRDADQSQGSVAEGGVL